MSPVLLLRQQGIQSSKKLTSRFSRPLVSLAFFPNVVLVNNISRTPLSVDKYTS